MRTIKISQYAAISAAAIVMSLTGVTAIAQPVPMGAHMRAGGPHAGGDAMMIVGLRNRLNLSAAQSAALDAILANAKIQAQTLHASAAPTLALIDGELAKAQPNLQTIAQLRDSLQPQREALHKATRDQLIGFYGTLSSTQQQVVIDALRKMAAKMKERVAHHLSRQ